MVFDSSQVARGPGVGLVLTGGGARGAYQAGVLKAAVEILASIHKSERPFETITGMSAGSVNAVYLASHAHDYVAAVEKMVLAWGELRPERVYECGFFPMLANFLRWGFDFVFGSLDPISRAQSLLNTEPLRLFLSDILTAERIAENLKNNHLGSLSISATSYDSSRSVHFVQSHDPIESWRRVGREIRETQIGVEHIMASSAIPLLFPSVKLGEEHFGDGSFRNWNPLSSAIHLGARKLMIVSVRKQRLEDLSPQLLGRPPSIGQIVGTIINSLMMDFTEVDIERLDRINRTLSLFSPEQKNKTPLRPIQYLWIRPSQDIGAMARKEIAGLPWTVRNLMGGWGPPEKSSEILSYLAFVPPFLKKLIELGYHDGYAQKEQMISFFSDSET